MLWNAAHRRYGSMHAMRIRNHRWSVTPPQSPVSVQCAKQCHPVPVLVFTDNCDQDPQVEFTEEADMASCMITHTRTWTVEDACGNSTSWGTGH